MDMKVLFFILFFSSPFFCHGQYYGLLYTPSDNQITYDPDFDAVISEATAQGYTLPSLPQQTLMNQIVIDLKAAGIWSKLDFFALFENDASFQFGWINWVDPTGTKAQHVGSPTWVSSEGYTSSDDANYYDTNFNMATAAQASQTNVTAGAYVDHIQTTSNSSFLLGAVNGSNNGTAIRFRSGTSEQFALNTSVNLYDIGVTPRGETTFVLTQTSGDLELFVGGALEHDFLSTSTIPPLGLDIFVGSLNLNGTSFGSNNAGDFHIKAFFAGSHLTNAEVADLDSALDSYFQNN
jgi:hypothetical protein